MPHHCQDFPSYVAVPLASDVIPENPNCHAGKFTQQHIYDLRVIVAHFRLPGGSPFWQHNLCVVSTCHLSYKRVLQTLRIIFHKDICSHGFSAFQHGCITVEQTNRRAYHIDTCPYEYPPTLETRRKDGVSFGEPITRTHRVTCGSYTQYRIVKDSQGRG